MLAHEENQITEAVQKLSQSVVSIESTKLVNDYRFGRTPVKGAGSGVILSSKGFIVSNNHVVEDASVLEVGLRSGDVIEGRILGRDPQTDIAIIKVPENSNLQEASLGDSENLKIGQIALAVGNSLGLPGGHTVSAGVISALRRPLPWADFVFEGLLQTDAAINPGNSGGPLADISGRVIGINTAMIAYAQGIGFAIPINTVKTIVSQILENGRVIRPWLGISGTSVDEHIMRRFGLSVSKGIVLLSVSEGSPAEEAGLNVLDVIIALGEYQVNDMKNLLFALSKQKVDDIVKLKILRREETHRLSLRLIETPKERVASFIRK